MTRTQYTVKKKISAQKPSLALAAANTVHDLRYLASDPTARLFQGDLEYLYPSVEEPTYICVCILGQHVQYSTQTNQHVSVS